MPVYRAETRRQKNAISGAIIMSDPNTGIMLMFLGKGGLPSNGGWHETLEEAQAEAHAILGIEPADWVELPDAPAAVGEAMKATMSALDALSGAGIDLPDVAAYEADMIAKARAFYGDDLIDDSLAADEVDEVDVGALAERHTRDYQVFAEYSQFYIWDIGIDPGAPCDYDDEDCSRRVKVAEQCVVIMPERDDTVPVQFEVRPDEPQRDDDAWDHVVECSIDLPTGRLQISTVSCGDVANWRVPPGSYRVRASFGKLGEVDANRLDGNDHYRVVLWPGDAIALTVLKQWTPGG
ncbi:MAG: hypothetical protein H6817_08430 [Phycisphaerales bacterium]|nr:hypothetical protein [Phycisphaerales bacterium]